jgi:anthranilate phosphoribosyltransferase
MKNVVGVRKQLPVRTIFNVLGPLTNPAGAERFLLGAFAADWTDTLAEVLGRLGAARAWVVHGDDGTDEISITGPTRVSRLVDGRVETSQISPEQFGMSTASLDDLAVDSPQQSADAIRGVLEGQQGPRRDIILLNAAAALVVADEAGDMAGGLEAARKSLDEGAASGALERLIAVSNV